MQDHLFFIAGSYAVATVILSVILTVTLYRFYRTKRRLSALTSPK